MRFFHSLLVFIALALFYSCNNEIETVLESESYIENDSFDEIASTRALSNSTFNWETITTMPTASGQSSIDVPWIGNGALTVLYDNDVVGDHHENDGWVMLGHTFGTQLDYPHFILYNIYRGLLRVYMYIYSNSANVSSSTNMKDVIYLNSSSGYTSSILNFLGRDIIDVTNIPKGFSQIQPTSSFLSSPFMVGQWYMMEYELAYDPSTVNTLYSKHQLVWAIGKLNINNLSIQGSYNGTVNGTFGASSSSGSNFMNPLKTIGNKYGAAVLSGFGNNYIANHSQNGATNNDLGLPNNIFSNIVSDVNALKQAATNGYIPVIKTILSAIVGGTVSNPIPLKLDIDVSAKLTGTISEEAGITAASFYLPGSKNLASSSHALAYNKPLGVFNIIGTQRPKIHVTHVHEEYEEVDPWNGFPYTYSFNSVTFPSSVDCSSYIKINPEVLNKASVTIAKQEIVARCKGVWIPAKGSYMWYEGYAEQGTSYDDPPFIYDQLGVRVTIRVKPKNSSKSIFIVKTIKCDEVN